MKKVLAVFLLVCVCVAACVAPSSAAAFDRFDDVKPTDWYYEAVEFVYGNGLMIGVSETSFAPDLPVTRAMLVTVLYRLEGSPAVSGERPFRDVAAGKWYTDAVTWAGGKGLVLGYEDGGFRPDETITREQFATILYRYAQLKGGVSASADLTGFADAGTVSDWAVDAMKWAYKTGLIRGRTDTELCPQGETTRAEMATILMRFLAREASVSAGGSGATDKSSSGSSGAMPPAVVSGFAGAVRMASPKVTLSVDAQSVPEGVAVTYTATLNYALTDDITVTLSNGQTVAIPAGEKTGAVLSTPREDDPYFQGEETVSVSIVGAQRDGGKSGAKILFDEKEVNVQVYEAQAGEGEGTLVTLSVDKTEAKEGETLTYTAAIENAPKSDITVTLLNGQTITIAAGETSGSVTTISREDDAYRQGEEILSVTITAVTQDTAEDGLEAVVFDGAVIATTVTDDGDETVVTLRVDKTEAKEGETVTYTATIGNAPKSDITVTLSNAKTLTIAAGETSGSVTYDTRADDVYRQGAEILSVTVTAVTQDTAEDGLEAVAFDGAAAETTVGDVIDETVVTLRVDKTEAKEGETLTYTAAIENAPKSDITVTLLNGQTITIAAGETSGSVICDTRADDAYKQGAEILSTEIFGVSMDTASDGLESLAFVKAVVETTVTDDGDETVVTLRVDKTEAKEGETLTYTATIGNAPKSDITVTLSNAKTLTIAAGETSGSVTYDTRADDVYRQGAEILSVAITAVTQDTAEDGLEAVVFDVTAVEATVTDDGDETTVTLSVDKTEAYEGETLTYTATIGNAPKSDITVTLSNAKTLTIAAGETSGSVTYDTRADDAYKQGAEVLSVTVTAVTQDTAEDGLEAVAFDGAAAETTVGDDGDRTTVYLALSESTNGSQICDLSLKDSDGEPVEAPIGFTFTLSDGKSVTFEKGHTAQTYTPADPVTELYVLGVFGNDEEGVYRNFDVDGDRIVTHTEAPLSFFEDLDFSKARDAVLSITVDAPTVPAGESEYGGTVLLNLSGKAGTITIKDLILYIYSDPLQLYTGLSIDGVYGTLKIFGLNRDFIKYNYELNDGVDRDTDLVDVFSITFEPDDGKMVEAILSIHIKAKQPSITPDDPVLLMRTYAITDGKVEMDLCGKTGMLMFGTKTIDLSELNDAECIKLNWNVGGTYGDLTIVSVSKDSILYTYTVRNDTDRSSEKEETYSIFLREVKAYGSIELAQAFLTILIEPNEDEPE